MKVSKAVWLLGAMSLALGVLTPASAYIGPGLGVGVIAAVFGAIGAFFMMIAGLVWYPVKVMLRKRREKAAAASGGAIDADLTAKDAADE